MVKALIFIAVSVEDLQELSCQVLIKFKVVVHGASWRVRVSISHEVGCQRSINLQMRVSNALIVLEKVVLEFKLLRHGQKPFIISESTHLRNLSLTALVVSCFLEILKSDIVVLILRDIDDLFSVTVEKEIE